MNDNIKDEIEKLKETVKNTTVNEKAKQKETNKPVWTLASLRNQTIFCFRLLNLYKIVENIDDANPLVLLSQYIDRYLIEKNNIDLLPEVFTEQNYGAEFQKLREHLMLKIGTIATGHENISGSVPLMYDLFEMYGV